jgi:DNA-binding Lrp family transcriptional regulator
VIRTLRAIPEVTMIYSTNGAWDLVVEIRAETLPQFDRVLREIREVKGVTNSESSLLLSNVTV